MSSPDEYAGANESGSRSSLDEYDVVADYYPDNFHLTTEFQDYEALPHYKFTRTKVKRYLDNFKEKVPRPLSKKKLDKLVQRRIQKRSQAVRDVKHHWKYNTKHLWEPTPVAALRDPPNSNAQAERLQAKQNARLAQTEKFERALGRPRSVNPNMWHHGSDKARDPSQSTEERFATMQWQRYTTVPERNEHNVWQKLRSLAKSDMRALRNKAKVARLAIPDAVCCVVCMVRKRQTIFLHDDNTAHWLCCAQCATRFDDNCPVCRRAILCVLPWHDVTERCARCHHNRIDSAIHHIKSGLLCRYTHCSQCLPKTLGVFCTRCHEPHDTLVRIYS